MCLGLRRWCWLGVLGALSASGCTIDFEGYRFAADDTEVDGGDGGFDAAHDSGQDSEHDASDASDAASDADAMHAPAEAGPDDGGEHDATDAMPDAMPDAEVDGSTADASDAQVDCPATVGALTITLVYSNGYLNHQVVNNNSGTVCSEGAIDAHDACTQTGLLPHVNYATTRRCNEVTLTDDLDAFDWVCEEPDAGSLRFRSLGLRDSTLLASLIDFSIPAWRPIRVTLTDRSCGVIAQSEPQVLWSDVVRAVDVNAASPLRLDQLASVYVVTAPSPATVVELPEIVIANAGISLVIDPALRAVPKSDGSTGWITTDGPIPVIWIEGRFDCVGRGVCIDVNSLLGRLRHIELTHSATHMGNGSLLRLAGNGSRLEHVTASSKASTAVELMSRFQTLIHAHTTTVTGEGVDMGWDSSDAFLEDVEIEGGGLILDGTDHTADGVRIATPGEYGLLFGGYGGHNVHDLRVDHGYIGVQIASGNNTLQHAVISNAAGTGIQLGRGSLLAADSRVINVQVSGTAPGVYVAGGIDVSHDQASLLLQATAVAHRGGFTFGWSGVVGTELAHAIAYNNEVALLTSDDSSGGAQSVVVRDAVLAGSSRADIVLYTPVALHGQVLMTSPDACEVYGTDRGLRIEAPSTCVVDGDSSATLSSGHAFPSPLRGQLAGDSDNANANTLAGAYDPIAIDDWLRFASPSRVWGKWTDTVLPNPAYVGGCRNGSNCAVQDWSLTRGNAKGFVANVGDAQWVQTHTWSANDLTACNAIVGAVWSGSCTSTYLQSATELFGDGLGNDNGLCESGEACSEHRDLGATLAPDGGTWAYVGPLSVGAISGVDLYRWMP